MSALVLLLLVLLVPPGAARADTFSVLTFNAQVFNSGAATAAVVQASGADLVGLQERRVCVFGCTGFGAGDAAALGYEFHAFGSTGANLNADDTAVASRFPIVEVFPDGVRVELPSGRSAWIWVVHLTPYPYEPYDLRDGVIVGEAEAIASAQATRGADVQSVLSQMGPALASGDPVFLVGDFNEPSHLDWTPAASLLHFGLSVDWPASNAVAAAGLFDAFRAVRPDPLFEPAYTWTPEPGPNEKNDRIDFIHAAGDDLNVLEAIVLGEDGVHTDLVVTPWVSDHRAVLATFSTDPACSDGFDQDGDGLVDFPDEPGCTGPADLSEAPDCSDGLDNDGDGGIDWDGAGLGPADDFCVDPAQRHEAQARTCGLGPGLAVAVPILAGLRRRRGAALRTA